MAQFLYEAKTKDGHLANGVVEAISEEAAIDTLHEKELMILSLSPVATGLLKGDISRFWMRPKSKDVMVFTRQLATVIAADIPLVEGLQTIASQTENPKFSEIISEAAEAIRGGSSLSAALAESPKLFGDFYVSLIKSGEISGLLEQSLIYLADYLEKGQALNSKIRGALGYPIFILCALVGVTGVMMTTVVPKMLAIVQEAGATEIPFITQILIAVTTFFNDNIILMAVLLAVAGVFLRQYIRTENGQYRLDRLKISFPRLGKVARNIYIARLSETLSTLIKSGVPVLESLKVTSEIVGNRIFRDILLEAREHVRSGGTVSQVLAKYPEFPKLVPSMLAIGEKTGKTDFMLENIYRFFNFEAERDIQNMSALIEPILILLLGAGVGVLVAAVLLPIFSLVQAG